MNSELFKAILAMDSYNRGYGEGIKLPAVPNVTQIGNATIIAQSDIDPAHDAVAVGFYAVAYTIAGGETVISYRGTNADTASNFLTDAVYGYGVGTGFLPSSQGNLALSFYNAITNKNSIANM